MSQTCPNCGLLNPDNSLRCDCGFDFKSGTVKESYLHTYRVENTRDDEQCTLSVGEALRGGWQTAKTNPKVTIFYVLFMYALQWGFTLHLIFKIMPDLKGEVSPLAWVQLGLLIVSLCVAYFFALQSLSVIALKIARGQSIANEKFFYVPKFAEYIKVFLFTILFLLILIISMLLIIPGFLFCLRYSQAYWIILEKEGKFSFNLKNYLSAMKRSAELTKGFRTTILGILFSTSLIFVIISKILGSFAVYEGHDTENMLFLISSDLVKNFSYVFNAFVMSYVYVKLNPSPDIAENS